MQIFGAIDHRNKLSRALQAGVLAFLAWMKCPALFDASVPGLLLPTDIAMPISVSSQAGVAPLTQKLHSGFIPLLVASIGCASYCCLVREFQCQPAMALRPCCAPGCPRVVHACCSRPP